MRGSLCGSITMIFLAACQTKPALILAGQITQCGSDQTCLLNKRVDVSNAFFLRTRIFNRRLLMYSGYTEPRLATISLFRILTARIKRRRRRSRVCGVFADRARLVGSANLAQDQLALANLFVSRPEFLSKYAGQSALTSLSTLNPPIRMTMGPIVGSQRSSADRFRQSRTVLYRLRMIVRRNPSTTACSLMPSTTDRCSVSVFWISKARLRHWRLYSGWGQSVARPT